ncbi:MAG: hypothetical protein PHO30_05730 [Candidatus Omnitrophica bacterium]|nr:hypothetical protein [Candidatus Omnitrophota bacterium]
MYKTPKSIERIEANLSLAEEGSLRHSILSCAKQFKSSWLELGQYLIAVHKDKLYKEWGYLTFEAYCAQEIGIRKETGIKLIRSYYFLEKEEPQYVKKEYLETVEPNKIPSCGAVDTLRQVKNNKDFTIADYERMKRHVFEEGKEEKEVKDVYRAMMKSVRENDPEEARTERRTQYVRRLIGTLQSIKREAGMHKFLSGPVLDELADVIKKIESELSE